MKYPERIAPAETSPGILAIHLKRYVFAAPWARGARVLDAGCGVGYGTALLAEHARSAVGLDKSAEAIARARADYAAPNVEFVQGDVRALPFDDGRFDLVCAFEVIEHVSEQAAFLGEVVRVLGPKGTFVVSTPRVDATTFEPENPFHRVELSAADFEGLLRDRFDDVELYGQRVLRTRRHRLLQRVDALGLRRRLPVPRAAKGILGTAPMTQVGLDGIVIAPDGIERATELVALCRRPR